MTIRRDAGPRYGGQEAQLEEAASAMEFGPLPREAMAEISGLLAKVRQRT